MQKHISLIRKFTLANAFQHNGKAAVEAVIAKVLGENPELKTRIKEISKEVAQAVSEVNKLSLKAQEAELCKLYPEFLKAKKAERKELPKLPKAQEGEVVLRMAPEPNGHLHIGHGICFFFNYYYAQKYKGKLILRFEDTNPENEKFEFYKSIEEDLKWLGISWDEKKNNSDDLDKFYSYAEHFIQNGHAYVCQCPLEEVRKNRAQGNSCKCRAQSPAENLVLWKKMHKDLPEGSAILRFKGDMNSLNSVMRDPTLFRIIEVPHPLQRKKYRVWPLYDFANSIEDALCKVTHIIRSNEFEQRNELQNTIRNLLGFKNPEILHYSRIKVSGSPTSKREITELMKNKIITGWDDPRLVTLKAFKKRGILQDTVKELAFEVRMTFGSTTIDWKTISGINRKLLDKKADRYFFVPDPVKLIVKNAPKKTAELKIHPDFPERGTRKVKTSGTFYIAGEDAKVLKKNSEIRLKDLYNIKIISVGKELKAKFTGIDMVSNIPKIQWVTEENLAIDVIVPDLLFKGKILNKDSLKTVSGLAEISCKKLKVGRIVQFERFGFCKKDSEKKFIFANK